MPIDYEKIRRGRQLRDVRQELNATPSEVERFTGIPQQEFLKWETTDAKIPRRHRSAVAIGLWALATERCLEESGLPKCAWEPDALERKLGRAALDEHVNNCPTCNARTAYATKVVDSPPFTVDGKQASPRWRTFQQVMTGILMALAVAFLVLTRLLPTTHGEPTLSELQSVVEEDPTNAEAQYSLGLDLMERERFAEALDPFRAAVDLDPENADPHNSLGWTLLQLGRFGEAVPILQEAVALNPEHPYAYHNLGAALLRVGRFSDAADAYKQAVRVATVNPHPFRARLGAAGGRR